MRVDIHPETRKNKFRCITCGSDYEFSTILDGEYQIESCKNCHRFYTGVKEQKARGKVAEFQEKYSGTK